jgi:hypothetical protein
MLALSLIAGIALGLWCSMLFLDWKAQQIKDEAYAAETAWLAEIKELRKWKADNIDREKANHA